MMLDDCRATRVSALKPLQLLLVICLWLPFEVRAADSARREFSEVIASKPNAANGEELFAQCVACHGSDAAGLHLGSTPRIAGQHYRVLVRQLIDYRYGRRWDFRMEQVAADRHGLSGTQDIADVAWFVSRLDRGGARGVGDGEYLELGATLYATDCVSCHGIGGEGNDVKEIPRIGGQHAAYLVRQIHDTVDGRRPPLTRTHRKLFAGLTFEEVLGLTDYLSRAGWQLENPPREPGAVSAP